MIDVVMPKMGESITEGTILEWKKEVGDSILNISAPKSASIIEA